MPPTYFSYQRGPGSPPCDEALAREPSYARAAWKICFPLLNSPFDEEVLLGGRVSRRGSLSPSRVSKLCAAVQDLHAKAISLLLPPPPPHCARPLG